MAINQSEAGRVTTRTPGRVVSSSAAAIPLATTHGSRPPACIFPVGLARCCCLPSTAVPSKAGVPPPLSSYPPPSRIVCTTQAWTTQSLFPKSREVPTCVIPSWLPHHLEGSHALEQNHSEGSYPLQQKRRMRRDGPGMGDHRSDVAQTGSPGLSSPDELARGLQRHPVRVGCGLPMGSAAENFSGLLRGLVIDNSCGWQGSGVFDRMMDALHDFARAQRGTEPAAGTIGSQSVKMTEAPARAAKMTARRSWAVSGWPRRPGDRNCGSRGDRAGPRLLTGSDCDAARGRGKRQEIVCR